MSLESAKRLVVERKYKRRIDKAEDLAREYTKILNGYLDAYFTPFLNNTQEENDFAYKTFNKDWKATCYKVNLIKSYKDIGFELKHNLFEIEVANIISKNPQFQIK